MVAAKPGEATEMEKLTIAETTIPGRRAPARRVQLICEDPSLTKQSFVKDSSIRRILEKYVKTGILGDPTRTPIFGDFSNTDYQSGLDLVANVKSQFERLPVKTRERFKNDPSNLLDFLADEKNFDEAVKLGLRQAPPPPPAAEPPKAATPPSATPPA